MELYSAKCLAEEVHTRGKGSRSLRHTGSIMQNYIRSSIYTGHESAAARAFKHKNTSLLIPPAHLRHPTLFTITFNVNIEILQCVVGDSTYGGAPGQMLVLFIYQIAPDTPLPDLEI
jgi:hypothetical protein